MSKNILGPNTTVKWIGVNGTADLSSWCTNLGGEDATDPVDVTGMEELYREYAEGLRDATVTASFVQDYASGGPDQTLGANYYAHTAGTLKINPDTNGTVVYTLVSKIYNWSPVTGGPGEANTISTEFRNFGTAGLTRGTS